MVQVLLIDTKENKLVGQCFSDQEGIFKLSHSKLADPTSRQNFKLRLSLIGYEKKEILLNNLDSKSQIKISLTPSNYKLKEVTVKAKPMNRSGDTLTYFAHAFTHKSDSKLEEIIARMPDVEVTNIGTIKYQGKAINKFYIEGLDLLEGRYSIASRNIRPLDVASIQILENHEPIRVEQENSISSAAAMNIKLKESAKSRWLFNTEGAIGGLPLIAKASATAMNFKKRTQTIIIAKGDCTGDDIIVENKRQNVSPGVVFHPQAMSAGPSNLFSPRRIYSSFWGRDRRRDNRTVLTSINNLWLLNNKAILKFNLNYSYDDNRLKEVQSNHYFDPQLGIITLSEITNYRAKNHATENEVIYEHNSDETYFKNILSVNYHHLSTQDHLLVNEVERNVRMNLPQVSLSNSGTLKKNIGQKLYTFGYLLSYQQRPQSLRIGEEAQYDLASNNWTTSLSVQTTFSKKRHQIKPYIGIIFEEYGLSSLGGDTFAQSFNHRSREIISELRCPYTYHHGGFRLVVSPSLRWGQIESGNVRHQAILPGVHTLLRYDSKIGKSYLSYSFMQSVPSIEELFPYAIRKNYTLKTKGIEERNKTDWHSIMLRHEGFSQLLGMNYQVQSSFNHSKYPRIYALTLEDDYLVYQYLLHPNTLSSWGNEIGLSKYISQISLTISGMTGHSYTIGKTYQQNSLHPYQSNTLNGGLKLSWSGSMMMTLDYDLNGKISWVSSNEIKGTTKMYGLEQNLKSTILLGEYWGLSAKIQHYYDRNPRLNPQNLLFVDSGIYYEKGKYKIQIDLTNLTNIREHRFVWQDMLNHGYKSTQLRGREVLISLKISQ